MHLCPTLKYPAVLLPLSKIAMHQPLLRSAPLLLCRPSVISAYNIICWVHHIHHSLCPRDTVCPLPLLLRLPLWTRTHLPEVILESSLPYTLRNLSL